MTTFGWTAAELLVQDPGRTPGLAAPGIAMVTFSYAWLDRDDLTWIDRAAPTFGARTATVRGGDDRAGSERSRQGVAPSAQCWEDAFR